jgi:hypothetical protein
MDSIGRKNEHGGKTGRAIHDLLLVLSQKGEKMMIQSHLIALETKHAELDKRLMSERLRPLPDNFIIATLKKQKLKLKEALNF